MRDEIEREVRKTESGGRLLTLERVCERQDVVELLLTQTWTQHAQRVHLVLLTTTNNNMNANYKELK